jgi:hypothetical protein
MANIMFPDGSALPVSNAKKPNTATDSAIDPAAAGFAHPLFSDIQKPPSLINTTASTFYDIGVSIFEKLRWFRYTW